MSAESQGSPDCILESPFPCLQVDISPDDLRQTAYEIFVAAHRFQESAAVAPSPIKSGAVGRFKKVLTMGSSIKKAGTKQLGELELMRLQMEISEKSDSRTRKALARSQLGYSRPLLVPVELLQHISSSDFADFREYQRWQKRQLKILECGLLSEDKENADKYFKLKQALEEISGSADEAGKHANALKVLRSAAGSISGADSYPVNIYLYEMLLRSIFDTLEETIFVEEFDDLMLMIKSTWNMLGINKLLHSICFIWILFRQFVATGQTETELLKGAEMEMRDLIVHGDHQHDYVVYDLLNSTLTYIQSWSEKRLIAYHKNFPTGGKGLMENLVRVALLAIQILHRNEIREGDPDPEEESEKASARVAIYIQSTLRWAFDEIVHQHCKGKNLSLETLASRILTLASKEKDSFSSIWKQWHPHPTSVAVSTLHSCCRVEVRRFLVSFTTLSNEAVQVLQSIAELEKRLVQLDMEDKAVFDSRHAVIPPMIPFTLDANLAVPLQQWIQLRLQQLQEWLERNFLQEQWNPNGTREHYALSLVEMLRFVKEAIDAFFTLPVSQHPELLNDLIYGVDCALKQYIELCASDCVDKGSYSPDPALRRHKEFSSSLLGKVTDALQQKQEKLGIHMVKCRAQSSSTENSIQEQAHPDPATIRALCVRINTVHQMQEELVFVEKKLCYGWQEVPFTKEAKQTKLEKTRSCCTESLEKLWSSVAYTVVFERLSSTFWESLYIPSVMKSRIGPVIDELNSNLEVIAGLVLGALRNRVVNELMMTCFEEFLRILRDLNSVRGVTTTDVHALEEDFLALKELFKADGDGLAEGMVEKAGEPVEKFLASLRLQQTEPKNSTFSRKSSFKASVRMMIGKTQVAPSQGQPGSASSLSQTVEYKCHAMASRLVKKTYELSKWS